MIVAQTKDGKYHKADGLVNRGEWFGETWLVSCNIGVFCYKVVIEGEHEQQVIDELADSERWGNLINTDVMCDACEAYELDGKEEHWDNCTCDFAGNDGHRVDLSYCHINGRCKVLYFERPDNWTGITAWGGYLERVT